MGTPQLFDLDENGEPKAPETLEQPTDELESNTVEEEAAPEEPEPQEEPEPTIPEKYRGKSVAELVNMLQAAEQYQGRQSSEIGELRSTVDNFIQSQTVAQQESTPQEEDLDFYTDPDAAVQRAIETHPKVQQAEAVSQQLQQGAALAALQRKHPDFESIVNDSAFNTWVQSKPALAKMYDQADKGFDIDSADTLLSLWKERVGAAAEVAQQDKAVRTNAARAASTGDVGNAPPNAPRKKTYRRSDIIKLMQNDEDRYLAMQDEIMQAYAEGRVV